MGTWIFAIGALVAIVISVIVFRFFEDKHWAALAAGIVCVLVFGAGFFIASEVDPEFTKQEHTVECIECGNEMTDNDSFCSKCGLELVKAKRCTECGEQIDDGDKFCADCGKKVKEQEL